jgi:hypothetical protein
MILSVSDEARSAQSTLVIMAPTRRIIDYNDLMGPFGGNGGLAHPRDRPLKYGRLLVKTRHNEGDTAIAFASIQLY